MWSNIDHQPVLYRNLGPLLTNHKQGNHTIMHEFLLIFDELVGDPFPTFSTSKVIIYLTSIQVVSKGQNDWEDFLDIFTLLKRLYIRKSKKGSVK